ncbi:MAG: ATP-binding protein, partial [Candidatus Aminicenantaceae bacterium]
ANDIYVDLKARNQLNTIMDRAGVVYNIEQRMMRYDGKIIWTLDTARVVLDSEGKTLYYEGSMQDITKRKKTEQKLLEAKKKAELSLVELKEYQSIMIHKERLAALGELSAGIAHEINNPLSIVSGYVQMLVMDDNVDIRIKDNAKIIEQQVGRASVIVDKLLQFSKGAKSEIKKVDVNQIVENILVLLKHQFKLFNISVVKQLDLKLDPINADPSQLQHVFHNIISNAVEAMPKGGTLTVSTAVNNGYVEVQFADTGWGIPKKNQGRLFDPFFSTKEAGTGLGLSLSFGIVEAHKGQIEVKSSINKGATFILKFPR